MTLKEFGLCLTNADKIEVRNLTGNFQITFKNDDELWRHIRKEEAFGEREILFMTLNSPHSSKLEIVIK